MSNYDYKSNDELERIDRAEHGDIKSQLTLITFYWYGFKDDNITPDENASLYWKQRLWIVPRRETD